MAFTQILKNFFLLFISLLFLCSCNDTNQPTTKRIFIQGAFFGSSDAQKVLMHNKDFSFSEVAEIKDGFYRFEIKPDKLNKAPFTILYTYDVTPTKNPKPPYIQTQINPSGSIMLPAILVFGFDFKLEEKSKTSLKFEWDKPVFSQSNNSVININTSFEQGFPRKKYIINTRKVPYEEQTASIDLTSKMKDKEITLKERLKKHCKKSKWNIAMPYKYPEGLYVVYTSNQVTVDVCE